MMQRMDPKRLEFQLMGCQCLHSQPQRKHMGHLIGLAAVAERAIDSVRD